MARKVCSVGAMAALVVMLAGESVRGQLQLPSGTENFEAMSVGASVTTLVPTWPIVNPGLGPFTVVAASDGGPSPVGGSARWLRIDDDDAGPSVNDNRFYGPTLDGAGTEDYVWTFHAKVETAPAVGSTANPRFTIQHDNAGFKNAWGIEFARSVAGTMELRLVVVAPTGGAADASVPIHSVSVPGGLSDWITLELCVSFQRREVSAKVNGEMAGTLPISVTGDATRFRFCYRGEGANNTLTALLDDVSVSVVEKVPSSGTWAVVATTGVVLTGATVGLRRRRTVAAA
ncbi:MAG: hypothetical protein HOP29_02085 [Phycisphaerales bacterium]|nr:hypothetical protein [Phycisphaerales bacterium]